MFKNWLTWASCPIREPFEWIQPSSSDIHISELIHNYVD